jgi:putative NIF3 family GTP cyclohydrolase 1 type 2
MKIKDVISTVKAFHKGTDQNGVPIDEATTRDKVLYGNPEQECSGIVTTCWASAEVIRKAARLGVNLIIVHEALFWNRGDKKEWLSDNQVFLQKKKLLDETGIVVWRDHDYIHSGIPLSDGEYVDGIFYGIMIRMGWEEYLVDSPFRPLCFEIPKKPVQVFARELLDKFNIGGIKVIGDLNTQVNRFMIAEHIIGPNDNPIISKIEEGNYDTVLAMEITDFTVSEYIRDSGMLVKPRTVLAIGHFNLEEVGMEYMMEYLPALFNNTISCHFVQSGDSFSYITKA